MTFNYLTLLRSSVTSDWRILHFEFLKIVAAPKWYETWWLLWHLVCEKNSGLILVVHWFLIKCIAVVTFTRVSQTSVLEVCRFGERVRNSTKRKDCFTAATNARVQRSTGITKVNSTRLTVGGSNIAIILKSTYCYFKTQLNQNGQN